MAQQSHQYTRTTTLARNTGINSGASETIILDGIPCFGSYNLAVTIVVYTGSTSACALYGSPDGINYMAVSGFSTFGVATGAIGHAEATGTWAFLRLTTTGTALIDAYIYAV